MKRIKKGVGWKWVVGACVIHVLGMGVAGYGSTLMYDALKTGVGIRGGGMGGSGTGNPEGPSSIFYNPAGLSVEGGLYQLESMDYKKVEYERREGHIFYRSPIGVSNWTYKRGGGQVDVMAIGVGKRNQNGVDWGVTYKGVKERINGVEKRGWSADIGTLIHFTRNVNVGVVMQDVVNEGVEVPMTYRGGVAVMSDSGAVSMTSDVVYSHRTGKEGKYTVHYGVEYAMARDFVVRGGGYENYITGGVSIGLPFVGVEYGFVADASGKSEMVTMLGFSVGKGPQKTHRGP